jgi:hypothetical protein
VVVVGEKVMAVEVAVQVVIYIIQDYLLPLVLLIPLLLVLVARQDKSQAPSMLV